MELYNIAYNQALRVIMRNPTIGAGRSKMVAVVYDSSGQLISFGFNQYKSHPLQARFADHPDKIFLHAEIDAIANSIRTYRGINSARLLSESSLYVFRFNKDGTTGMAKPCLGCQRAIRAFDIKSVFWSGE